MTKSIEERFEESFKYGGNSQYLDHLYEQYIEDPSKIEPEWKKYFDSIQNGHFEWSQNIFSTLVQFLMDLLCTVRRDDQDTVNSPHT